MPVGTPITDPRMTLPMNKYPHIPPEAHYDPGPPVVQLPPGVPPGPGPALTPPYPLPFPPVDRGPQPPPLPFVAPPDEQVPPYGVAPPAPEPVVPAPGEPPTPAPDAPLPAESGGQPQASGLGVMTYDDQTGVFTDPKGPTGIFNSGIADQRPAETWVDLMRDPRTL